MIRRALIALVVCGTIFIIVRTSSLSAADGSGPQPAIPQISERLRPFIKNHQTSGIVTLVAVGNRIVHLDAIGESNLEQHTSMRTDALFRIASMTKPITATAVMILQDDGKLSVNDPVAKFLPEFKNVLYHGKPAERQITLRDLMTHTSGVVGKQENTGTLKESAEEMARRPLGFEPGTKWEYSPGLSICGRVIEVASGVPYEDFLRTRIFVPLGMSDTTFHPSPQQKQRAAILYAETDDGKRLVPGKHWLVNVNDQTVPNPSGGLYSTATDLVRFYQMILNHGQFGGKRIISEAAVRQMTSPQTGDIKAGFTPGSAWGLGWGIVREPDVTQILSPGSFGHGGAFGTQAWIDPKRRMIFVLLVQRMGLKNGDASDLRRTFQDAAVHAIAERSP